MIFLISFVVILLSILVYLTSYKPSALVNRPPGLPIIGHLLYFDLKLLIHNLQTLGKKYGPFYELFIFQARYLVINDFESIKEITMKRPKYFRRDISIEGPFRSMNLFPSSLFIAEGQTWSRLRRLLSTPFNRPNADAMTSSLLAEVSDFISRLKRTNGEIVNTNSEMMQYTLRVIIRVALGNFTLDEYLTTGQIVKDTNCLFDYVVARSLYSEMVWSFVAPFSSLQREAFAANDRLEKLVTSVLENSTGSVSKPTSRTFLDILISESSQPAAGLGTGGAGDDEGTPSKLSKHEVVANIKTMVLAGSETTSVVLSWCLYYLSLHPEHLHRLREEAAERLPNLDTPSSGPFARIELPFASACLRESLRLKGPAPILGSCEYLMFPTRS
jgi:cytochrome P450